MATEQDVYTIDTTGAVSGMEAASAASKKTGEALDDTKKKSEGFGAQLNQLGADLTARYVSVNAAISAIKAVGTWLTESVTAYNDAAREEMRWQQAMQMAGVTSRSLTSALRDQAEAFEASTGTQAESVMQMQALLAQMGVAPKLLLETADAALRLANATGQDATSAARTLAQAYANNSDELKKYGVAVDDATFKQKGFAAVLDKVKERFPEVTGTIPPQVAQMNALKKAWDDFGESVGGAIANSSIGAGVFDRLTGGMQGFTKLIEEVKKNGIGNAAGLLFDPQQAFDQLTNIRKRYEETLARAQGTQAAFLADSQADGEAYARSLESIEGELQALAERADRVQSGMGDRLRNLFGNVDFTEIKNQMRGILDFSDEGGEEIEGRKKEKAVKTLEQRFAAMRQAFEKGRQQSLADQQRAFDAEADLQEAAINKQRDLNIAAGLADLARINQHAANVRAAQETVREATLGPLRQMFDSALLIAQEGDAAMLAEIQRSAQEVSASWEGMKNDALGWGQQMLQGFGNFLGEMLTSNTKFNKQMFELQVKRETAGMSEADAAKKRADMERQMTEDRAAAFLKMTEDMLVQVAIQAGIKAVWEGAEAIAAFASYRYAEGTQHLVAAGLYAGVAVAAGGTAAIISSSRPMTSDERSQLDAASKETKQSVGSGMANEAAPTAAPAQTIVNQYIIGIAGMTEQQQGQELTRVQDAYNNMRTGGG